MMEQYSKSEDVELKVVFLPGKEDIIVDIREESEKKKNPLRLKEKNKVIEIPFFEINHKFKDLDNEKTYLFYCEK